MTDPSIPTSRDAIAADNSAPAIDASADSNAHTSAGAHDKAPSTTRILRRLFLTLFLRGRTSRGLRKSTVPTSVGKKLLMTILMYTACGFLALTFLHKPVIFLSIYLHATTFVFLGFFIASSAGDILFNNEEVDILLHRPVKPRALLLAKVWVLTEVSLWLGLAFNLAGFGVGLFASNGSYWFPAAHLLSTILEAVFCTGCVVLTYQLCLRWFGRERLDGLMTIAQIGVLMSIVLSGQILPQVIFASTKLNLINRIPQWIMLLPPIWFAGIDDALAGSGKQRSWLLALAALLATVIILFLAFGKLAQDYEIGLQHLNENTARVRTRQKGRRWIDLLVNSPPLSWWLRNPVERASFLLTTAYLLRDREVKLRVYPSVAPILMMPIVFLMQRNGRDATPFMVAYSGGFIGMLPLFALMTLQYSSQWQASDLFRAVPIDGPSAICHGARRAVLLFLTAPLLILLCVLVWCISRDHSQLLLLIPGLITVPLIALVPSFIGGALPLSLPTDQAKAAGRSLIFLLSTLATMPIAGLAAWSWSTGWFRWMLLGETIVALTVYIILRITFAKFPWPAME